MTRKLNVLQVFLKLCLGWLGVYDWQEGNWGHIGSLLLYRNDAAILCAPPCAKLEYLVGFEDWQVGVSADEQDAQIEKLVQIICEGFIDRTTKPRQEGGVCRCRAASCLCVVTNSRERPGSGRTVVHGRASARNIPAPKTAAAPLHVCERPVRLWHRRPGAYSEEQLETEARKMREAPSLQRVSRTVS